MNTKLRYFAVVFAVTLALVWCFPSVGQVLKGSISGTVTDPQGAVVSGAQVQAKNVETGVVVSTTSDSSGLFRLNLLPVGTYSVSITAKGFKTTQTKGVVVNAGDDAGLGSLHLSVGETSTTVEVTAAAPLIETTQAQVTNTFAGTTLETFAGVQENEGLDRLALFVPGIASSRSNNFSNTNGASISSNGLRGRNNDQELDGQNNNDNSVGGPGLFVSDANFVQQYVIVTNNFGPEYGRNAGSVVNIITKSGTNNWHGSVFGTERSSYMDALTNTQRNTIKPGSITPSTPLGTSFTGPPRYNDEFTGGTIGGPVLKNKVFLFGGFDNEIFSGSNVFTTSSVTPTPSGLAALGGCGVNATALSVLQNFGPYAFGFGNPTPRPTGTGGTFATQSIGNCDGVGVHPAKIQVGGVTRVVSAPFHGFDWVLKNDIQLGSDNITSRYIFNRGNNFNISDNGAGGWTRNTPALSQAILESWTHNFSPRMVNEARVSFSRLGVEFGGGLNPFEPVAGNLAQAFTNISFQTGGALGIGPATNLPQSRLVNSWQAQDNWNYVVGKHSFKAGVNWTYQRSPNIFLPNLNGQYRFASLNSFLTTDQPNRITIAQGKSDLDFREYDTFVFAGDDWKISQNLTLNLGLTWTYYGQPANLFNQITTARETKPTVVGDPNTALWLNSLPLAQRTNPQIPSIKNSFGPSVGFAYSPQWGGFITGHGKTTIRGGYRLLYDPPFYNIFVNISSSAPMTFLQTLTPTTTPSVTGHLLPLVPIGPNVRASLASVLAPNVFDPRTNAETNVAPNFGPDKVHSWTLGFERELGKNAAFEARYSGNHAVDLFQTVNGNPYLGTATSPGLLQTFPQLVPAGLTPCAATTQSGPGAGTDVGRVSCGNGVGRIRNNGGFSDYHALQMQFRANNLFRQLTMQAGYTWSKNLDNVSEIFATGGAGNTQFAAQNPFQTGGAERGISGLDYTHVGSILLTEQLPFFKEQHGFVGHVLGGWAFSVNYLLASGQPYTPVQNNAEALSTGLANYYDAAFVGAFVGTDIARPFVGNLSAPVNSVGAFAHEACASATSPSACAAAVGPALALLPANQLVSVNALNASTPAIVNVTNSNVRWIVNTVTAQTLFGTPFGNSPRNTVRDAISNIANVSVLKNFKLGEHANFEMHLTALNALNHFNFSNVDVNIEDAGVGQFGRDFANPRVTTANGRTVYIGGKLTF